MQASLAFACRGLARRRPIRYTKFVDPGRFRLVDTDIELEPTVLDMTDWYCPARRFVMRQEVRYKNQHQVVDVVDIEQGNR
ncbi:hypothetical protein LJR296_007419 [Cupriavidus necator]|uniref:hypothetical protein n=1 Tax=Cupriavidus necator TaxID=106590 RepID=UPI003ECF5278